MNEYKRFLLFTFSDYYPSGGLNDCIMEFDTLEEWESFKGSDEYYDKISHYAYVFDCVAREVIWNKD